MHGSFEFGQGLHIDPLDPSFQRPDPGTFTPRRRRAFASQSMARFRESLLLPHTQSVRDAVLDDLSAFFGYSAEECRQRCLHWEKWSAEEWKDGDRSTDDGIASFYQSTKSWSFDLLWYAYLQAEGYAYPVSVAIAEGVPPAKDAPEHLDFGSGIGATGQLFSRLGYRSSLADISSSLQEFAKFRLDRRGDVVTFIDLNKSALDARRYDVITAIDTLVHVPDLPRVLEMLHLALKPGGLLFANFDTRPPSEANAWHLYADDLPLRWTLQRAGFEPLESLDLMSTKYQWVDPTSVTHMARGVRDLVLLKSPLRPAYRKTKTIVRQLLRRA
ncbi:MAG TPA: class I SAM-dependent methyltransferase [Polyangiaceae bacterium]|nr:class I SAM-dependent methyltransferase [Polyangiaceae bacterium]